MSEALKIGQLALMNLKQSGIQPLTFPLSHHVAIPAGMNGLFRQVASMRYRSIFIRCNPHRDERAFSTGIIDPEAASALLVAIPTGMNGLFRRLLYDF